MAGKFEKFAQRFALQLFRETFRAASRQKFLIAKKILKATVDTIPRQTAASPRTEKAISIFKVFFRLEINFYQTVFKFHFSRNYGFCARWCKSSPRHEKHEMTNGLNKRRNEIQFRNRFLNLAKWPSNTVSTKGV